MRCERLDDLLPAYMDGDLPRRLNERVSEHLDACERCRREMAAQQRALRSLNAVRPPVSIDLWADFSRRLQAQAAPRPSPWRPLWQPGLATALAAAVVALVLASAPKPGQPPAADLSAPLSLMAAAPNLNQEIRPGGLLSRSAVSGTRLVAPAGRRPLLSSSHGRTAGDRPLASRPRRSSFERARQRHPFSSHNLEPSLETSGAPRRLARPLHTEKPAVLRLASVPLREGVGGQGQDLGSTSVPPSLPLSAASSPPGTATGGGSRPGTGDPVKVAEALVSVEQDAASSRMKGELLRLAREVARVGGEAAPGDATDRSSGPPSPADDASQASAEPTGT
jgi:hypothetical protein